MARPVMLVVAGPSGSGKSVLYPVAASGYASFNVDDRCRDLHGTYVGVPPPVRLQAQRECEEFVAEHIAARTSFAVETTLRTDIAIRQAMQAKASGFRTHMIYVATADVAINVERVALRVLDRGHGAPADRVREIYARSLSNLPFALVTFDRAQIFDNSAHRQAPTFVCEVHVGRMVQVVADLPPWLRAALAG